MPDSAVENRTARRHPPAELRQEVDANGKQYREPTQPSSHTVDHRDWCNNGHTDFEWTKANVCHAVFGQGAALELRVHNLQQRNTGGDGSRCPTPAEQCALKPVLTEECGWEPQQEEGTNYGADYENDGQRYAEASDSSWCNRSDTEGNQIVRCSTGNGGGGLAVQVVLRADGIHNGAEDQAENDRHRKQWDRYLLPDAGNEVIKTISRNDGQHDEAQVQCQWLNRRRVGGCTAHRRTVFNLRNVALAQVLRQAFRRNFCNLAAANAPVRGDN